jgi:hypothetical protein
MGGIDVILKEIGTAATNELAFVAYIVAVVSWFYLRSRVDRNKNLLQRITALPQEDRIEILREEMGTAPLQGGLTPEQWLQSRIHQYYFMGFLVLCGVIVIVVAIFAYERGNKKGSSDLVTRKDFDERPFVLVETRQPPADTSEAHEVPRFLETRLSDSGAPAKNLRATCMTAVDPTGTPLTWPAVSPQPQTFPYLLPNQWVRILCPAPLGYTPAKNLDSIELGFVDYEDVNAKQYRTPFCFDFLLASNNNIDVRECSDNRGLPELK